jgi:beta-mannosidase
MHGFPVQRTVDFFTRGADGNQLHPQSRLIDCHNKGHGAHMRIARYLAENFRFDMTSLPNFVYSSQLLQSEAYGYALRCWKRLFNGPGDEQCAGAIIWQLNDVYPVTSWAFVDYFLRPKPAFYTIRRSFAPFSLGVERTPAARWVDEDKSNKSNIPSFAIFAHNTTPNDTECKLTLRAHEFLTGKSVDLGTTDVTLKHGQNNEIRLIDPHESWTDESIILLETTLTDAQSGKQVARFIDWPEPYRYLYWPDDTKLSIKVSPAQRSAESDWEDDWETRVAISSNRHLKGVWVEPVYNGTEADDEMDPLWSDNMIDLIAGEEVTLLAKGLKGRDVNARFLADWEVGKSRN